MQPRPRHVQVALVRGHLAAGVLEEAGAEVPSDESDLHVPWARLHVQLARDFGPAELVEPIYLRVPDAEKAVAW